ncbi:hypothetical protein F2Q69_00059905 [Brassica cretica]|uniref:Uncharacterized protein n=1 Tax=Brassica cretica TaxID=69181 RepID=A0A8S9RQJ2_BRACR|nr:hypothetical protein F2Q69_00059905 [Brassica cretica]
MIAAMREDVGLPDCGRFFYDEEFFLVRAKSATVSDSVTYRQSTEQIKYA